MKEKNLLASVALFGQLYNSDNYKDIISIIGDFIRGAIVLNKKFSASSFEIKNLLEETYDFHFPESIVKTVLHSVMKDKIECEKGVYTFHETIGEKFLNIESELIEKEKINNSIFSALINFISEKENRSLTKQEEEELFDNFNQFLFENGSSDKFTTHISTFIIKNEVNSEFIDNLNAIREGIILYQGIRYTANLDKLGKWKDKLVIFLNTEYLFSALGYNGVLYKEIFFDFHKLVEEINSQESGKLIFLSYLPDTMDEIESFFYSAETILSRKQRLRPWKTAMKMLVDSCKESSDIVSKKVNFYSEIEKLGIEYQEFNYELEEYGEFNVEDESIVEELKTISKEQKKEFDEDSCYQFFKLFTKVNFFRRGKSNLPFEKIGYIFITDSSFGKYLGHNNKVKFEKLDTSFAKDIDYITTRFWIKLKKGFSEKTDLPKSFNVLTKARIILASQINSSLSKEFNKLVREKNSGLLSEEEAIARSYALREKPNLPTEITSDNIDSTFDFLNNEEYLNNFYQEKIRNEELIKQTQQKNLELQEELDRRDKIDKEREEKERLELESIALEEKKLKFAKEVNDYNTKKDEYCKIRWNDFSKESKGHFWRYLQFIVVIIIIIFILASSRDKIFSILNIELTEYTKLYYTGIVAVIGFLATTIRSFFDTKNILKGMKLIFHRKFRKAYKEIYMEKSNISFKIENNEPKME